MLKKIIDKRNYIIFVLIILLLIYILILNITKTTSKIMTYNYFDEDIALELYTKKSVDNIFKGIDKIYKKYDNFYKNKDTNNKEYIKLLKYGKNLYEKTEGYIDITSYKLLENIKKDKPYNFKTTVNSLDFNNKETLKNINIQNIIGARASKKVEDYLRKNSINTFVIRQDSNIITGSSYNKKKYNIPIMKDDQIIDIVSIENKSIAIKGNTDTFKPYMVNPITSNKNKENKMVVVIGNDINEVNFIANTLYLMDVKKGKEYVKKYKVEAMWYTNDGTFKTKGFKKNELKN